MSPSIGVSIYPDWICPATALHPSGGKVTLLWFLSLPMTASRIPVIDMEFSEPTSSAMQFARSTFHFPFYLQSGAVRAPTQRVKPRGHCHFSRIISGADPAPDRRPRLAANRNALPNMLTASEERQRRNSWLTVCLASSESLENRGITAGRFVWA